MTGQKNIKMPWWLKLGLGGSFVLIAFVAVATMSTIGDKPVPIKIPGMDKNFCLGGETQSLTISGYSIDDRTSANTDATNLYSRKGSGTWIAWTLGNAITALEAGANYEFVIGTGLTDHTDNTHGPHFEIDNLKCRIAFSMPVYNDEDEDGTTFTYYNADNNAAAESFSANQAQTVSVKMEGTAEEYFGNPTLSGLDEDYMTLQDSLQASGIDITFKSPEDANPNVCYYQLNSTVWDKPDVISIDGITLAEATCPTRLASNDTADIEYCYSAPILTSTQSIIKSKLNTDDSNAPATDDTFGCYAAAYYVNGDNGNLEYGVEDEDNNAVGLSDPETVTLDNT